MRSHRSITATDFIMTSLTSGYLSRRLFLSLMASSAATPGAFAQSGDKFPSRRLTLTVPYGASSSNDICARILAEGVSAELGQPVVVENKPGAGGTLGIGQVIRGAADGYNLALISTSSVAINRALYQNLTFDPARDLTPVSVPSSTPNALIVSADQNISTVAELIDRAKSMSPPRYFSAGSGTSQHLSAVLFSQLAKLNAEHVPYRGQEGITGMMGGQTLFGFASIPSVVGLVRSGKLRILATTGERPSSAFPDRPLLTTLGYPQFGYTEIWYGVAAPSGVPAPIKETLAKAFNAAAAVPATRERLAQAGFDPVPPMTAEQLDDYIKKQVAFWHDLVKDSGAKAD